MWSVSREGKTEKKEKKKYCSGISAEKWALKNNIPTATTFQPIIKMKSSHDKTLFPCIRKRILFFKDFHLSQTVITSALEWDEKLFLFYKLSNKDLASLPGILYVELWEKKKKTTTNRKLTLPLQNFRSKCADSVSHLLPSVVCCIRSFLHLNNCHCKLVLSSSRYLCQQSEVF